MKVHKVSIELSKSTNTFAHFTELNETFTETREALQKIYQYKRNLADVEENIADTSLKILCQNLYSVKRYDKTNVKVFALTL